MKASVWHMKQRRKQQIEFKKKTYVDKKKCDTKSSRNGEMRKRKAEIKEKIKCRKFG